MINQANLSTGLGSQEDITLVMRLIEKLSFPRHCTATPRELEILNQEMRDARVPEGVQWSTKEEYEDKRKEVSILDTRTGLYEERDQINFYVINNMK